MTTTPRPVTPPGYDADDSGARPLVRAADARPILGWIATSVAGLALTVGAWAHGRILSLTEAQVELRTQLAHLAEQHRDAVADLKAAKGDTSAELRAIRSEIQGLRQDFAVLLDRQRTRGTP